MAEVQPGMEATSRLERKEVELLVRGWNLLFNRCLSYSFPHPLVQETVPKVWALFQKSIELCGGSLNIMLQDAMFFIEGCDVMYQPNNRRVADHLKRFGVESISLQRGFGPADFDILIDATSLTHPDAAAFLNYIRQRGCSCLDVNQVSLRAIREGESIAAAGASLAGGGSGGGGQGDAGGSFEDIVMRAMVGRLTASELEGNVALVQMLADPQSMGKAVIDGTAGLAGEARAAGMGQMVMNVLSHFATQKARTGYSIEELLAGIYAMRSEMLSMVKAQRGLDQSLAENEVEAAADAAFDQTVSKIIADEWKSSKGNVKRVANVLGRVVPGKKELRRILPRLKAGMLETGCTLQDWYALVAELGTILQGDKALEQLAEAAQEFGVTPDEVISELRRDPKGAAKLLLVASEIRRSGGDQAAELAIQSMLDTLDNAGDRLAEEASRAPQKAAEMASMMERLHGQMREEISTQSMDPAMRGTLEKKLDLRMHRAMFDLKSKVLATHLSNRDIGVDEKAEAVAELVRNEDEIDGVMGMALSLVGGDEAIQEIARQIQERVHRRLREERERSASRELPAGVYPKAVAEFFLRYETRRCSRYAVPFAAMLVSFQGLPEDRDSVDKEGGSLRGLFHVLAGDLRRILRDVDFVGSLGYNRLLVVLPMTISENLGLVVDKIRHNLQREVALPDGSRVWVRPRVGQAAFDHPKGAGIKEVMAAVSQNWQEDI